MTKRNYLQKNGLMLKNLKTVINSIIKDCSSINENTTKDHDKTVNSSSSSSSSSDSSSN